MTTPELTRALLKEARIIARPETHSSESVLIAMKRAWRAVRMSSLGLSVIDGDKE